MYDYYNISNLNPIISTGNLGDCVINKYCSKVLYDLFPNAMIINLPTRERLSKQAYKTIASSRYNFISGTNLLCSKLRKSSQWNVDLNDILKFKFCNVTKRDFLSINKLKAKMNLLNPLTLFGVGWVQYEDVKIKKDTKLLLNNLLSKNLMHSVRDEYTKQKLNSIGITNVLNTACPTMWNLTEDLCSNIPNIKHDKVVTTLTNYNQDLIQDSLLIDMLCRNYKEIYLLLQSIYDYDYFKSLKIKEEYKSKVKVLPPSLEQYKQLLMERNIDYVGSRLHGGIYALNHYCRTLILGVDNRAKEISKDTNLPYLKRSTAIDIIENKINSSWNTEIQLPIGNITKWKEQFL